MKTSTFPIQLILLIIGVFSLLHSNAQLNIQFNPTPASYNINTTNPVQALNVEYDQTDPNRQAFHLFLPDVNGNYPLVIYIHGGGFVAGNRNDILNNATELQYYLENGIAYASIGYRLLQFGETEGVIKCLNDVKRGLQFIRNYATDLHIDANKIVLKGNSAGAGIALWLGTHPDMADLISNDPIETKSTRVCAVYLLGCQASYDGIRWETDVFNNWDGMGSSLTIQGLVNLVSFPYLSAVYGGIGSVNDLFTEPNLIALRTELDMIGWMSSDDAPIYNYNNSNAVEPSDDVLHHPRHAIVIDDYANAAGIAEVKTRILQSNVNTTAGELGDDFLIRHLNTCILQNCNTTANIIDLPAVVNSTAPVMINATPPGGNFSGTGVAFNIFNPDVAGPGFHTITYAYNSGRGCISTTSQNVFVFTTTYNFVNYNLGTVSP